MYSLKNKIVSSTKMKFEFDVALSHANIDINLGRNKISHGLQY